MRPVRSFMLVVLAFAVLLSACASPTTPAAQTSASPSASSAASSPAASASRSPTATSAVSPSASASASAATTTIANPSESNTAVAEEATSTAPIAVTEVAEEPEPVDPILILPTNRAQFLPGSIFDFRVEVREVDALPDNFAVTVNGQPANELFGTEPTEEAYPLGEEGGPAVQSVVWRGLSAPAPGNYNVQVTAGPNTAQVTWTVRQAQAGQARNVILFIADGMTVPQITAARVISRGNTEGKYNGEFAMDQMEELGLVHTSGLDTIMTDSANSASAYNTGHKAAVNALGTYPDSSEDSLDDPRVETFAEMIKRTRNMATGIVTTADWTDATPAAVFAHTRRRADRPEIAAAALDSGLLPEVILGGGARYMLPQSVEGSRREDDRDLFAEYEAAGYSVVLNATDLLTATEEAPPERLLGLFHPADMNVWLDRNVYTDNLEEYTDQPGLDQMTLAALEVLQANPNGSANGWFLEVEAGSVDKQMHPLDQERALADLIEYDNAVAAAIEWTQQNAPDTLIVVTSDHGHGYDVYGTVDVQAFNAAQDDAERRNAIGIYDDAGFPTYTDADGDFFPDTWEVSRTLAGVVNNNPDHTENFQVSEVPRVPAVAGEDEVYTDNPDDDPNGIVQPGNLPLDAATGVHTLQDVPVFAQGPGAAAFGGVIDNTEIFFGMASAIGLDPSAEGGRAAGQ